MHFALCTLLITIDASRAFVKKRTGTENYSYHLIQALAKLKCQHEFRLYLKPDQAIGDLAEHFEARQINWPYLWTQAGLALESWLHPSDLLFIPAHVLPFLKNPKVPVVVTVHDLHLDFLPQQESLIQKLYLNRWAEILRARLATHIIAVSESTKKDIVARLGVDSKKINVVYEGVSRRFAPEIKEQKAKIKEILKKHAVFKPYLLFVGTIQPRKNLARLIEAFSLVREQNLQLALVGQPGWMTSKIYAAPKKFGVEDRVKFVDYADDDDLPYLYAGAYAFILPSLHEGFGLPVLEAMACGTPVIVSRTSSLPEVAGEAGIYVNPKSVKSIADGIVEILKMDETAYQEQSQKCLAQAQKFSWEKTAQETLQVFEKVLASIRRGYYK